MKNPAQRIVNNLPGLLKNLRLFEHKVLYVGVPADDAARDDDSELNNATLAYIHDNGAPEANIPARPFMKPGMQDASKDVAKQYRLALEKASVGKSAESYLHRAGSMAASAIRNRITEGIPPPLAESTLKARARGSVGVRVRKGAIKELEARAAGAAPSMDFAKPLIVTGAMKNSITYVIKDE